jgi:hypothetical protein
VEIPKEFIALRKASPFKSVSLGWQTVILFSLRELVQAQVGYSTDGKGNSLIGTAEGDWLENWLVIGYEDLCGDPIFIDTGVGNFPVYTAMHGAGEWRPKLIAVSFANFIQGLRYIKDVSSGRESPAAIENKPLPSGDCERILKLIESENQGVSLEFWEAWLIQS